MVNLNEPVVADSPRAATPPPQPPTHIYWIDNLKAFGILLVIFAHTVPINSPYIYSFHVPLFFFASGFLAKDRYLTQPLKPFLTKNFYTLIVPYIVFGMLTYLAWFAVLRNFGENLDLKIPPLKPLYGMLTGFGTDRYLQHNPPLWFLPCLFMTAAIFSGIRRISHKQSAIALMLGGSGVIGFFLPNVLPIRLYANFDIALVAVVFYGVGYLIHRNQAQLQSLNRPPLYIALLLACTLAAQLYMYPRNGVVDMFFTWYGTHIVYFFGAAFCGLTFWSIVSSYLPPTRLLTAIARESLALFLLHKLAFQFITAFMVFALGFDSDFKDEGVVWALFYTVGAIVMILPAAAVIKRIAPWALGRR